MESILVVDDEEFLRNELLRVLGEEYAVHGVGTGAAALGAVAGTGADLVLLDLNLPDLHGIEVLRPIKARAPETLVIVVTGCGSPP